jgi:hypothetical protein
MLPSNALEKMFREMYAKRLDVTDISDRIVKDIDPERFKRITGSTLEGLEAEEDGRGDVRALATDRGEHLVEDPAPEALGLGLTRAEHETVEPGLKKRRHLLGATRGVHSMDPLLVAREESRRRLPVAEPENREHVRSDPLGGLGRPEDADRSALEGEREVVHRLPPGKGTPGPPAP